MQSTHTRLLASAHRRCLAAVTEGGKVKAEVVILPDGEQHKSLEVLQKVWDKALECRCEGMQTVRLPTLHVQLSCRDLPLWHRLYPSAMPNRQPQLAAAVGTPHRPPCSFSLHCSTPRPPQAGPQHHLHRPGRRRDW